MTQAATSLATLLSSERAPQTPVAWRTQPGEPDREIPWAEFRARVAALRDRLASWPPGRIALYTQDSYAFAVGLFAIWHAGRVAVCPPNDQPGTRSALANLVIGSVSDGPFDLPERPLVLTDAVETQGADLAFAPLAGDAVVTELFTSGTTGRGKAVAKTLDHLSLEVESLDRQFGTLAGDAPVFASASHQHLYGMLFRVLWPLASARPFHASTLLHAEELIPRLQARGACVLASVPAHLKRLAEREGLEDLARACRLVFSSGGPLAPEIAERWERASGAAPIEIFGSTETGGVAARRQGKGHANTPWTPFPEVGVRADDGRLRVASPFVSGDAEADGFAMGDRVELHGDGRFTLGGRIDRVLKIGEKRLSLPDMEQRLIEHPWVRACALLPLEQGGETRAAAAVVLAPMGADALATKGRRAVGVALGETLANEWDRTLLPRAWRFVEALPEDAQGKITTAALRRLFDETSPATRSPQVTGSGA